MSIYPSTIYTDYRLLKFPDSQRSGARALEHRRQIDETLCTHAERGPAAVLCIGGSV